MSMPSVASWCGSIIEGGRDDISEILALTANYRVNKYLTLSAVSYFGSESIEPKRFRLPSG